MMVRLLWVIVGLACALPAQTRRITHVGSFMGSRAQVTPGEAEVLNIEIHRRGRVCGRVFNHNF